jgi:hypothetical protein
LWVWDIFEKNTQSVHFFKTVHIYTSPWLVALFAASLTQTDEGAAAMDSSLNRFMLNATVNRFMLNAAGTPCLLTGILDENGCDIPTGAGTNFKVFPKIPYGTNDVTAVTAAVVNGAASTEEISTEVDDTWRPIHCVVSLSSCLKKYVIRSDHWNLVLSDESGGVLVDEDSFFRREEDSEKTTETARVWTCRNINSSGSPVEPQKGLLMAQFDALVKVLRAYVKRDRSISTHVVWKDNSSNDMNILLLLDKESVVSFVKAASGALNIKFKEAWLKAKNVEKDDTVSSQDGFRADAEKADQDPQTAMLKPKRKAEIVIPEDDRTAKKPCASEECDLEEFEHNLKEIFSSYREHQKRRDELIAEHGMDLQGQFNDIAAIFGETSTRCAELHHRIAAKEREEIERAKELQEMKRDLDDQEAKRERDRTKFDQMKEVSTEFSDVLQKITHARDVFEKMKELTAM